MASDSVPRLFGIAILCNLSNEFVSVIDSLHIKACECTLVPGSAAVVCLRVAGQLPLTLDQAPQPNKGPQRLPAQTPTMQGGSSMVQHLRVSDLLGGALNGLF